MSLLRKILVANRGEIACRIMKTAKRMGVQCVAIHSDIDKSSKFVEMADQAYRVGPNPSIQSYLNSTKILEIAKESGCEGLHPGFGFLSQNASFAQECEQNGVKFIGPPSSAITSMGSKSQSKKIMTNANVPVVPGYHQENQQAKFLYEQAEKIGYPVLIKAVSGGGGKGMRIVRNKGQFYESLESCQRESKKAFKDDRVLIEKYITRPRHIEVQIFGDQFGNYVHLFQRDCSIQRRHQKVVEQAPSNISEKIRQSICMSAVNAAKAVGYYNAGTVEFIFDLDSNQHYFMEMNTRLQVEHPISQMITGFDFVEWQLLVASKFPLPKKQEEINKKGNAIEVRIYSQDPFNNFLPGNGTLKYFKEPSEQHKQVRIETGVREKDTISTFYDPMIAKLVTYGPTRDEAISLMKKALTDYRVVGLPNNLRFLKRVISDPVFQKGDYDTSYIQQNESILLKKDETVSQFALMSSCIVKAFAKTNVGLPNELANFRNVKNQFHKRIVSVTETHLKNSLKFELAINPRDNNSGVIQYHGKTHNYKFEVLGNGYLNITIDHQVQKIEYFIEGETVYLFDQHGDSLGFTFELEKMKEVQEVHSNVKSVKAPMTGTISKIFCKVGDQLKKGDPVFAVEAMKMEHIIRAPFNCKIKKINIKEAEIVQSSMEAVQFDS